jgi:Flp pilus assembly protein TadB
LKQVKASSVKKSAMSDDYPNSVNFSASEDIRQNTNTLQSTECQTSSHVHQIALANTANPGIITTTSAYSYQAKRIIFLFFVAAAAAAVVIIIIIIIFAIIIVLIRYTNLTVALREQFICRGKPKFWVVSSHTVVTQIYFPIFCVGPFYVFSVLTAALCILPRHSCFCCCQFLPSVTIR